MAAPQLFLCADCIHPLLLSQRGDAATVRQVLEASISNLMMNQHERTPETAQAIDNFLEVIGAMLMRWCCSRALSF